MLQSGWILRQTAAITRVSSSSSMLAGGSSRRLSGLIRSRATTSTTDPRIILAASTKFRPTPTDVRSLSVFLLPPAPPPANKKAQPAASSEIASILPSRNASSPSPSSSRNPTTRSRTGSETTKSRRVRRESGGVERDGQRRSGNEKGAREKERTMRPRRERGPKEKDRIRRRRPRGKDGPKEENRGSEPRGKKGAKEKDGRKQLSGAQRRKEKEAAAAYSTSSNYGLEEELQQWYKENHGAKFADKCIKLKRVKKVANQRTYTLWKAQFDCPMTKESFRCGTLKDLPQHVKFSVVDGQVVYFKMANARFACLARALDCFRYRQDKEAANTRACVEMPFEFGADLAAVAVEEDSMGDSDGHIEESGVDADEDSGEDSDEYYFSDEDDDEEYTITYLPGTAPSDTEHHAASNPMARVIGSWSGTTAALQCEMESVPSSMDVQPELDLQQQMDNAQDWIEQEQSSKERQTGSEHRVMLQTTESLRTLEFANSILKGLAKAHRRVMFQNNQRGVEQVASKIVNFLWTTMSAQPNADTYMAYLACLEGPDPESVATRAKKVLEGMKNGAPVDIAEQHILPKPTIGVVNTVIKLSAQVGGESGRFSLDGIENPNRDTVLSVLSCMSYPPTIEGEVDGFDPIFAQECIDQMKAIAERHPADASLNPDLQIYNAGLRWSGGVHSTLSRPYVRPVTWDTHAEIFQKGFQAFDEDSAAVQEAYRMHAWLEEMDGLGGAITPNVETYEAVMQAYVRTGAHEGVKQAEKLLYSLMSSPSSNQTLRMQTFHPIIAAWAYSGHEEGPAKVNKWISQLEALSEEAGSAIQIDSRVREAPLLANARRMTTLLESKKKFSLIETEQLVDTAHGCSIHLKDMCARSQDESAGNQFNTLLDVQMFVLVLHTWGKLGLRLLETKEGSDTAEEALSKMYETVEQYEGLTSLLRKKKNKAAYDFTQLRHMTGNAPKVYSAFLGVLRDAMDVHDSPWALDGQISSIERWVRRIDEFGRMKVAGKGKKHLDDFMYSDMYSYVSAKSLPSGCSETSSDFLVQIVKYLKDAGLESSPPRLRGDLMRLCFLTMDLLSTQPNQSSLTSTYKEIVETVCNLSNGPEEQEALLNRILSQVKLMQEQGSSSSIAGVDHDAIAMEIRKRSHGPRSSVAGRPVTAHRKLRVRSRSSTSHAHHSSANGVSLFETETMLQKD